MPPIPGDELLTREEVLALLEQWGHPYAAAWLERKTAARELVFAGEPAVVQGAALWRRLLKDESDKLYNQAWSALEGIKEAGDPDSVAMLSIDDFPSAVEQAWSLAPDLAGEHLALLRQHSEERYRDFLRSLAVGTPRELVERIECLAFWEDNAEITTDLRKSLCRLVREDLEARQRAHAP